MNNDFKLNNDNDLKKNFQKSNQNHSNIVKDIENSISSHSYPYIQSPPSISHINSSSFSSSANLNISQKAADLGILIDSDEFSKLLKQNPWQIDVKSTLEKIQKRLYSNSEIQLRIGGRVLYSTSRLINVKSTSILHDSQNTQDFLEEIEVLEDEFQNNDEDFEDDDSFANRKISMQSILGKSQKRQAFDNNTEIVDDAQLSQYLQERNAMLAQMTSINRFFNQDRDGNRYLSSPLRKVYRKVNFSELGSALIKTFKTQIRTPSKTLKFSPLTKSPDNVLHANLLKKAEEKRVYVEEQISDLYQKIKECYKPNCPVSFLSLIISPEPEGIVQTVLYLLQLINRKKIEIWQEITEIEKNKSESFTEIDDSGLNIFVTPR
ncbi:MAG: hypothetical protein DRO88_12060 [Promethearchaeia archaeon]|nr:MAG: hypothetical protein DRO88_12060 [Candidatus Lokiarchaeia archaeon]